jgi:hypothetical protein
MPPGVQLSLEEQLLADAQRHVAAHLTRDQAAALLGAVRQPWKRSCTSGRRRRAQS